MKVTINRSTEIESTPRLTQLEGMFDVPPRQRDDLAWDVDLPIENRDWNVGLIVGPSGCGKSTIARDLFPDAYVKGFEWPARQSIIDGFPVGVSIKDITALLSAVGFSSPPSWTRPFGVLSNGEQFRATLARALVEYPNLCVFDEFTSVVDRTVGKIGSHAVAKTVRRRNQKFIAVTCHDDVIDWLDPDWIYYPATATFDWRSLRGRPKIELEICRVPTSFWRLFAPHHYLTGSIHPAATCFVAFWEGRPVAFDSWLQFYGSSKSGRAKRGHRTVCLPDYQGVGIGNALVNHVASMWRGLGYQVFDSTGHPAQISVRVRSPVWMMTRKPSLQSKDSNRNRSDSIGKAAARMAASRASDRLTASFEYVGPSMDFITAQKQLNSWIE